jgi:hypothetical protein
MTATDLPTGACAATATPCLFWHLMQGPWNRYGDPVDRIPALVALRDIAAEEELTISYALFPAAPGFAMACRRPAAAGRGVVRGTDWTRVGLQARYPGMIFLVAPAEHHANPGTAEPMGPDKGRQTTPRSDGHTESAIRQRAGPEAGSRSVARLVPRPVRK